MLCGNAPDRRVKRRGKASFRIEVNLNGTNLTNANLTLAFLNGATLIGANLTGANLNSARLNGANLVNANLTNGCLTAVTVASSPSLMSLWSTPRLFAIA